jgi:hypothetical protein
MFKRTCHSRKGADWDAFREVFFARETPARAWSFAVFVPRLAGGVRKPSSLARGGAIALKSFQQFADGSVIAGRKKRQAAFLRPKNKPDGETGPAFKIVLPKTPNPQAGMKMWSSKTVANGIDRPPDFEPSRFW